MRADDAFRRLLALADEKTAAILRKFFKTGPGEYGEGDQFLGIKVPPLRKLVREFRGLPLAEADLLLQSPFHEARALALLILVDAFNRGDPRQRRQVHALYLSRTSFVNNWDLVDASAEHIVGGHLIDRDRRLLRRLARTTVLWERRIAIVATFHFIKHNDFDDTLAISQMLLADPEDLIHKAVGWMLREVGKRDLPTLETFLQQHHRQMPRTALRYAIERFAEPRRQQYLKGTV
jgi:3-methyladenine DNA glycosylase AlkD